MNNRDDWQTIEVWEKTYELCEQNFRELDGYMPSLSKLVAEQLSEIVQTEIHKKGEVVSRLLDLLD